MIEAWVGASVLLHFQGLWRLALAFCLVKDAGMGINIEQTWRKAIGVLVLVGVLGPGSPVQSQGLPALPKAVTPAGPKNTAPAPMPMPTPAVDPPLLPAAPKETPKSTGVCSALPEAAQKWMQDSLATLQGQTLRSGGLPKARDAFADVWINFKLWRDKGYDLDSFSPKVDAVYRALYPAGAFAPDTPFERFKEPRRGCKKSTEPVQAIKTP